MDEIKEDECRKPSGPKIDKLKKDLCDRVDEFKVFKEEHWTFKSHHKKDKSFVFVTIETITNSYHHLERLDT